MAQYTRQNFTTEQALGIPKRSRSSKRTWAVSRSAKRRSTSPSGDLEFAHEALHGTMFDQGARNDGAGAHCLQARQEVDFLFAEMRQQFCVEGLAGMCAGLDNRLIVAALRRTAPVHGKAQAVWCSRERFCSSGQRFMALSVAPAGILVFDDHQRPGQSERVAGHGLHDRLGLAHRRAEHEAHVGMCVAQFIHQQRHIVLGDAPAR